jgi:nucleoside-diphosphate-sugar epimerase
MKIAITGATGFIGSHLTEALVAQGHEVTCLARSREKMNWIRDLPVRMIYGDVCRKHSLEKFVAGQEVIVHLAGLTKAPDLETYTRVNVEGTKNVLSAAAAKGVRLRRFVMISSQEAMGPSPDGKPIGEDAGQKPLSMYGISKSLAEKVLKSWNSIPMTVIRPPAVYGPRDRDIFAYFKLASLGITPIVGYSNVLSVVYVKNLVSGICLAIDRGLGGYRSYFFTDGEAITWTNMSELISEALHRRTARIRIPTTVVRALGELAGLYSAVTHRALLLSKDKIDALKAAHWLISDQRARSELGYKPCYSTAQGVSETARWYRAEGWL